MENLKYSIFDLFGFAIPGASLIFCIRYVISFDFTNPQGIIDESFFYLDLSIYQILIFVLFSYILGFIVSTIGNLIFKICWFFFEKRKSIFRASISSKVDSVKAIPQNEEKQFSEVEQVVESDSIKYVIVREKSKANLKYIEIWNAMKNFCCAQGTVFLILSVFYFIKYKEFNFWSFSLFFLIVLLLFFKAKIYSNWVKKDLHNAFIKYK